MALPSNPVVGVHMFHGDAAGAVTTLDNAIEHILLNGKDDVKARVRLIVSLDTLKGVIEQAIATADREATER